MQPMISNNLLLMWSIEGILFLLGVLLASRLLARTLHKKGLPPRSLLLRFGVCFLAGGTLLWILGLLIFGQVILVHSNGIFYLVYIIGLVAVIIFLTLRLKVPMMGLHLAAILFCNLLILVGLAGFMGRARTLSIGVIDTAKLHAISKALAQYRSDFGVFPKDLRHLVDANVVCLKELSPLRSHEWVQQDRQISESRPYKGACGFEYIPLPTDAPEGLVWVWEPPQYLDGEGAFILYSWSQVQWVTPEELERKINRTKKWLVNHPPQTKPASMPARAKP